MKTKLKIISVILSLVVLGVLIDIVIFQKSKYTADPIQNLHHAQIKSIKINHVLVDAYYFVPKDAMTRKNEHWEKHLKEAIEATKKFYEYQLPNFHLDFQIYPQIVKGFENAAHYNGESTSNGNPHALIAIATEMKARGYEFAGDLTGKLTSPAEGYYHSVAILYEDVGASAMILTEDEKLKNPGSSHAIAVEDDTLPTFLISDYFLTGAAYKDYGQTIFAHEFGHILGLKDSYEADENAPTSEDVMGSGRFLPIGYTFLSSSQLESLGVFK